MRKLIFLVVVGLLLFICGFVYWYYYNPYSAGTREGVVQKFSRKGSLFKTWEGEMQQQGFGQRGGTFSSKVFYFSVVDDVVADTLEHGAQGKIVRLHYVQYRRSLPWRGDNYNGRNEETGQYIVDRIEEVRPLQY
jgi:hypothetical protein